jgi:hypothetical protein
MGIRAVGAVLFHEDRQHTHDNANGTFSQFCESD